MLGASWRVHKRARIMGEVKLTLPKALSAPPLSPKISGTFVTTKKEVLAEAEPIDKGIRQLRIDMAANFYHDPEDDWTTGCRIGFSDAYVHGFYGLGGVKEPEGSPAYVAAYRRAFSEGNGYELGVAAKKRDGDTYSDIARENPAVINAEYAKCNEGLSEWLASNPQSAPPAEAPTQKTLFTEYKNFDTRWSAFYNSLFDLGVLDSGDAAIEGVRSYYHEYQSYLKRYQDMGFVASFVPPEPPKPKDTSGQIISAAKGIGTTLVIGAVALSALALVLRSRPAHSA